MTVMPPTMEQTRKAQKVILRTLPRELRTGGVGLTLARDTHTPGAPRVNAVLVNVRRDKDIAAARKLLGGDEVLGVPVVFKAVGRIVATGGLEPALEPLPNDQDAKGHARRAKDQIRRLLNRPPWGRGVGLSYVRDTQAPAGAPGQYAVRVMVQGQEHVAMARAIVGDVFWDVPVLFEAVGDFYPAPASLPTEPPPFGRPEGHIGGSYDWWWWSFGRPAGMPYDPRDPLDQEEEDVDRAVESLAQRLGIRHGGPQPPWLQGVAVWRDPDGKLGIKVNVQALAPDVLYALRGTLDATDPPTVLGSPLWVQQTGTLRALAVR
jgi:hypothetical protein